jgi:hypothetical protein
MERDASNPLLSGEGSAYARQGQDPLVREV